MRNLSNIEDVKALQSDLKSSLGSPAGQEVMKFLEDLCGWYDFNDIDPNIIVMKNGKRQVLATIKTLLKCKPEEIVALNKEQENAG